MTKQIYLNPDRDPLILHFLWKWKMASTKALSHRFFPDASAGTAFTRLSQLKRGGFIRWKFEEKHEHFVWILTEKGFRVVRDGLLFELAQQGFGSEHIRHDLITSAVHLGDFISDEPSGVTLLSEQQLRRFHPSHMPSWVPNVEQHRPDGYWHISNTSCERVLALEVELSLKQRFHYSSLARFFDNQKQLDGILWVVPRPWMANHLFKVLNERESDFKANHNFVLLGDFEKCGWNSKISLGKSLGLSVRDFVLPNGPQMGPDCPLDPRAIYMLDHRKSPKVSRVSKTDPEDSISSVKGNGLTVDE